MNSISKESSALEIASVCMYYLLLDDFSRDLFTQHTSPKRSSSRSSVLSTNSPVTDVNPFKNGSDDDDFATGTLFRDCAVLDAEICDSLASNHPFYHYASLHWTKHFALCESSVPPILREAAKRLIDINTGNCSNWLHLYRTETAALARADPNERIPNGQNQNALTIAAEHSHLDCVVTLLKDARTDINAEGRYERGALSFACGNGNLGIARHILRHEDCSADEGDSTGATPLFWAVSAGHTLIISELINRPTVDINHRDKTGRTAVSWAASDGTPVTLKQLLAIRGIDANLKDNKGKPPLSWAAGNGCSTTAEVLVRSKKVDKASLDQDHQNAISWASTQAHTGTLRVLLKYGCPGADDRNINGWTPLVWAAQNDAPSTIEALIATGAVNIEQRDHSGRTALSWAVEYGHVDVVRTLLREGADPGAASDGAMALAMVTERFCRDDMLDELNYMDKRADEDG
ncbi:Fc.00g114910.m01.CDS01 [Cosmosporella sp. VM-42]